MAIRPKVDLEMQGLGKKLNSTICFYTPQLSKLVANLKAS